VEEFRKLVLKETGVSFCTRRHFGRLCRRNGTVYPLRLFGIDADQIKEGMDKLTEFLK